MEKILVISRKHIDNDNPIYNSFLKGIATIRDIIFIDYFNEYALRGKEEFEKYITTILKKERIEEIFFMFVSGDVTLDLKFVCKISQNRATYMVFWDLEQHFEIIDRYYAQCANLVFLPTNREFGECFKLININSVWTFSLFDKDKYIKNLKRNIDVSFIGDLNKGNRKEYIKYLKQNGINIKVYGAGSKNGRVNFNQMIEILNRSKISLNFSDIFENTKYSFYKKINNRIKQTKGRVVEVCMSGAFLLTEHSNSLNDLLDTKNIDTFYSKEELLNKINYYLSNEKEREEKAKNAQQEVISKYDSLNISKYLNEKLTKKEYYIDKEFKKIYGTFRWFYFLEFLYRYQFDKAFIELKEVLKNGIYLKESFLYFKKMRIQIFKPIYITISYTIIKSRLKNIYRIIAYPAGMRTVLFLKKFNIKDKVDFIVDDNIKGNYLDYTVKSLDDLKNNDIVLITNSFYQKQLETKLKQKGIKYINPFKGLKNDIIDLYSNNDIVDVYRIFPKIGKNN